HWKNTDNCFLTDGKRLMTKKGSLDFLLLIYYIESRRRLPLDAFLFCCYTGLRYSDFVNLNEKNIVKMDGKLWLIFDSVKTGTEVKLPLNLLFEGKALTLLQKYQGKWSSFFSIKNNSSVNKELIRIGKLAKISKHFSFHSARHTNATLLIYKGANITTVQKLLGHKNLATTQIYGEVMGSTIIRDLKKCQKR
uniref:site-specific integrase n=1 Tax=Phocaeicola vulgatus TaxID=821 RepID=UPI00321B38BE